MVHCVAKRELLIPVPSQAPEDSGWLFPLAKPTGTSLLATLVIDTYLLLLNGLRGRQTTGLYQEVRVVYVGM